MANGWGGSRPGTGGRRPGAGRPKGSKTKIYKPHAEKVLAADGIMPIQVMLFCMRRHYRARRYDEAARTAAMVAPYIAPRLTAATVAVQPSLARQIIALTDEELNAHIAEFHELTGLSNEDLANVKPKGRA